MTDAASESRTREILETAYDAFVSIDDRGHVIDWNPQAEATFGWSREEVLGRELAEMIIPPSFREPHREGLKHFLATGEGPVLGQRLELAAVHRDGHEFPVELTISALGSKEEGYTFHAFLHDVSERKLNERYMETQHEATRVLAESGTVEEALPALLEAIGGGMDWPVGAFWEPVGDGADELACVAFWHGQETPPVEFEAATKSMRLAVGVGLPGRVWASAEPAWVVDVTKDKNFPRATAAVASGLHAGIAAPIMRGTEVLSVVEFFSDEIRRPDPALLDMLHTLSGQVGQFIERKHAEAEADRLKAEFFALVSHELRTPLTSIIGYHDLLVEVEAEKMGEKGLRFLEVMGRNVKRLDKLVADLLLLTQVEAGTFSVSLSQAGLDQIARNAVEAAVPHAEDCGVELTLKTEEVPVCEGDADRLAQVLDNLLSNAIKFTPEGGSVSVSVLDRGERALIEVQDTGPGVPPGEQEYLFERFYCAAEARKLGKQGVGLGLAIVKVIVEAHDGRIWLDSEPGKGTTFHVELPLRKPEGAPIG